MRATLRCSHAVGCSGWGRGLWRAPRTSQTCACRYARRSPSAWPVCAHIHAHVGTRNVAPGTAAMGASTCLATACGACVCVCIFATGAVPVRQGWQVSQWRPEEGHGACMCVPVSVCVSQSTLHAMHCMHHLAEATPQQTPEIACGVCV